MDYRSPEAEKNTRARITYIADKWQEHVLPSSSSLVSSSASQKSAAAEAVLDVMEGGGVEGETKAGEPTESSEGVAVDVDVTAAAASPTPKEEMVPAAVTATSVVAVATEEDEEEAHYGVYKSSWSTQFQLLLWRSWQETKRNKAVNAIKLGFTIFFAFLLCGIYRNQGNDQVSVDYNRERQFIFMHVGNSGYTVCRTVWDPLPFLRDVISTSISATNI